MLNVWDKVLMKQVMWTKSANNLVKSKQPISNHLSHRDNTAEMHHLLENILPSFVRPAHIPQTQTAAANFMVSVILQSQNL